MEIFRAGSRPRVTGPSGHFTGDVGRDPIIEAPEPARLNAGHVHFSPGARTNWHTHPYGQTLLITDGVGRAQLEGEPVREIRTGDVVWFPANVRHWHGAAPNTAMSHVTMQEADENGVAVMWEEPVSDADYFGPVEE